MQAGICDGIKEIIDNSHLFWLEDVNFGWSLTNDTFQISIASYIE